MAEVQMADAQVERQVDDHEMGDHNLIFEVYVPLSLLSLFLLRLPF